jgi:ATP-dependent RNA helicase DDX51/DBP6
LSRDPSRLAALGLKNPRFFALDGTGQSAAAAGTAAAAAAAAAGRGRTGDEDEDGGGKIRLPATLEEKVVRVASGSAKPLVLLALLQSLLRVDKDRGSGGDSGGGLVLVFANSVDSTHRLARLLQLAQACFLPPTTTPAPRAAEPGRRKGEEARPVSGVAEFSGLLGHAQRQQLAAGCKAGSIRVVVCSDGLSRGVDLEGVTAVVHYDLPRQVKGKKHTRRGESKDVKVKVGGHRRGPRRPPHSKKKSFGVLVACHFRNDQLCLGSFIVLALSFLGGAVRAPAPFPPRTLSQNPPPVHSRSLSLM